MSFNSVHRGFVMIMLIAFSASSCKKSEPEPTTLPPTEPEQTFIKGGDFSFLPEIEEWNTTYYNSDSVASDPLSVFKDVGGNTVRIRLWKDPQNKYSSLPEVIALAQRVREAGLFVWLDIHYSDWWADPGHQTKPAAWVGISFQELVDSVAQYTNLVVTKVDPDIVQIGNETNSGFLWPEGHTNNAKQFQEFMRVGLTAAKVAKPKVLTMIHYAGVNGAFSYFEKLDTLDFDLIGISYYPKWHTNDLNELANELDVLGNSFGRKVVLAELAYPFTLGWNDWTNNIIGSKDDLLNEFPPTAEGQAAFLGRMNHLIKNTTNGFGVCYWSPDWVAYKGPTATDGSPWENQALFNFNNVALPGLDSLCQ